MVNYCSVIGCGCNSKTHAHLKYFSLPKERNRQKEWLKAAGREDLIDSKEKALVSRRICSRHFHPVSVKAKHLAPDAVPTLKLPGKDSDDEGDTQPASHEDIVCNSCNTEITGFRYKCITCDDYDLCQKCEMCHAHPHHYMIRMPKPVNFGNAKNLSQNVKEFLTAVKVENASDKNQDSDSGADQDVKYNPLEVSSSDDEPITNYLKRKHDEGNDLSEDVKRKIRKEVVRALESKIEETIKNPIYAMKITIKGSKQKKGQNNAVARKKKLNEESSFKQTNIVYKIEDDAVFKKDLGRSTFEEVNEDDNELLVNYLQKNDSLQEVEFANVTDDQLMTVKNEETPIITEIQQPAVSAISDSLSEFLIKRT